MVATGKVKAPIVIGRDRLDSGSVASPKHKTEAMKDGSDAIFDWSILNAMINAVGVGIGDNPEGSLEKPLLLSNLRDGA